MASNRALFALFIVSIFFTAPGLILSASGQLTAVQPDGRATTDYRNPQDQFDTIYIFNQLPAPRQAHLKAVAGETSTMEWYRYNFQTQSFGTTFYTALSTTESSIDTLSQGGYRVVITGTGSPRTYTAWNFFNKGFDFVLEKDVSGNVPVAHKTCEWVDFFIDAAHYYDPGRFLYRNPTTGSLHLFTIPVQFFVRSGEEPESEVILKSQGTKQYFREDSPPYSDTRFYFAARDAYGFEKTDQIMYPSVVAKATLRAQYDETDGYRSGALEVQFFNESLNAINYLWYFGDGDSTQMSTVSSVTHTYYTPKSYRAKLLAISAFQCESTDEVIVVVDPSRLDVANVFSPNNDGINDYFKPLNVSIRNYRISIFDRGGGKVFATKGLNMNDWPGWDGKAEKGGDAPVGVYYYVLEADSWDTPAKEYGGKQFTGFFHLYR